MKSSDYRLVENFCLGLFLQLLTMITVIFMEFSSNPTIFSADRTFSFSQIILFIVVFFFPFVVSSLKLYLRKNHPNLGRLSRSKT